MDKINDILNFLNTLEVAFCPNREDLENSIRVKEILTNVFQDGNSEKLKSILQKC